MDDDPRERCQIRTARVFGAARLILGEDGFGNVNLLIQCR
jgi:hypothetical protein